MNATKNELQHNTMLHYYIGTTVNGAKGIAHTVKANPLWIVAMLVMAWLAYSVQDMRATESMGSIGHLMTVLQSVEMLAVAAIALVVVCYRIGSVTGAKQMYQDLLRGGIALNFLTEVTAGRIIFAEGPLSSGFLRGCKLALSNL